MKKRHLYLYLMKEEGMTQSQVAREVGVTRQAVSMALKNAPKGGKVQRFLSKLAIGEWFPIVHPWNSICCAARSLGVKVVKNKNFFRKELEE